MAQESKPKCNVDPVCNIDLAAEHGNFVYDFEEQTYYFCSELCKEEFAAQPEKYLQKEKA